jgi:hypothetical protein
MFGTAAVVVVGLILLPVVGARPPIDAERLRKTLPAELKPLVDLGIAPRLDEDDEMIELYLSGDTLTDEAATVKPPCKPLDGPLGSPVEVLRL